MWSIKMTYLIYIFIFVLYVNQVQWYNIFLAFQFILLSPAPIFISRILCVIFPKCNQRILCWISLGVYLSIFFFLKIGKFHPHVITNAETRSGVIFVRVCFFSSAAPIKNIKRALYMTFCCSWRLRYCECKDHTHLKSIVIYVTEGKKTGQSSISREKIYINITKGIRNGKKKQQTRQEHFYALNISKSLQTLIIWWVCRVADEEKRRGKFSGCWFRGFGTGNRIFFTEVFSSRGRR